MPVGHGAAMSNAKNKKQQKAKQRAEEERIKEQVDEWFSKFDTDGNSVLSREEVKALLGYVAGKEPSDEALDMALSKATESGSAEGITRKVAYKVVNTTANYIKEQQVIDPIFAKYDTDKSGDLDNSELLGLLRLVAEKGGHDPSMISDADASYVMELADKDNSGKIEKCELMWACATWKSLLTNKTAPHMAKKSGMCTVL